MAARSQDAAAHGQVAASRLPLREVATIVSVVFATTGVLMAGMQWTVSNNVEPLFLLMQNMQSQVLDIRDDIGGLRDDIGGIRTDFGGLRAEVGGLRAEVGGLRTEVGGLRTEVGEVRTEVGEVRSQVADVRERAARNETGLEQVQANQTRILDILADHGQLLVSHGQLLADHGRILKILERDRGPRE